MSTSKKEEDHQGQGVEAALKKSDIEPSLLSTEEEETDGNEDKEDQLNWLHKPLVTPASMLAFLAMILVCLATYFGVSTVKARNNGYASENASTSTIIASENIAHEDEQMMKSPQGVGSNDVLNPGTIILNKDGGMTISGYVKLPTDIEVEGSPEDILFEPIVPGITFEPGAVLDSDGHSISGSGSNNLEGITLNKNGGMTITGNVKLTTDIEVSDTLPSGAAITLADGAVLDCDGHSIINDAFNVIGTGIRVGGDKAQIKNCHVAGFNDGANVSGGATNTNVYIENSSFNNGFHGIIGENGSTFELRDVTANNNEDGISFNGWDDVKMNNVETNGNGFGTGIAGETGGDLEMNDVTAKTNDVGISVNGWSNVKMNNIATNNNFGTGIYGENTNRGTLEMNDVTAEDKSDGISVNGWVNVVLNNIVTNGISGTGIYAENKNGGELEMQDVTAMGHDDGVVIIGFANVILDTIETNENDASGMIISDDIGAVIVLQDIISEENGAIGVDYSDGNGFTLKGTNSFSNNGEAGLAIQVINQATVSVDARAEVTVNNNDEVGVKKSGDVVGFDLQSKASLEACNNGNHDWDTTGGATFTGRGRPRYICDVDKISGDGPNCRPCNTQKKCEE